MKLETKDAYAKHIANTASAMMAAARTAPKANGMDNLECFALSGEEKRALTEKMREVAAITREDFIARDADNIDGVPMVVLFGTKNAQMQGMCG